MSEELMKSNLSERILTYHFGALLKNRGLWYFAQRNATQRNATSRGATPVAPPYFNTLFN